MSAVIAAHRLGADAVGPGTTRTLLALIAVHRRDGRATARGVAAEAHRSSPEDTHTDLVELAALGLADVGVQGGLRPLVTVHQPLPNPEGTR